MTYHCSHPCGRVLSCGNHRCSVVCHDGVCPLCPRDVLVVVTCPCGSKPLESIANAVPRRSCLDPVASCGGKCGHTLSCGRHSCRERCHEGDCAPCSQKVDAACRCRLTKRQVPCALVGDVRCTRLCGTSLSCGRHYCREQCCADRGNPHAPSHYCPAICRKRLDCGHHCDELCHRGPCPPCGNWTTETLVCACGRTQLPPHQPCGTVTPFCPFPCQRPLPCGHEPARHRCHLGNCPPCTTLVPRTCVGGHATEVLQPCSDAPEEAVCDKKCGNLLPCGHSCPRRCHPGPCVTRECPCPFPCAAVHPECGHRCRRRCHHPAPCPRCKETQQYECSCGNRQQQHSCSELKRIRMKLQREEEDTEEKEATEATEAIGESGAESSEEVAVAPLGRLTAVDMVLPCNVTCLQRGDPNCAISLAQSSSLHRPPS